jgi:outer membrane protein OmpA-like peptidoglycan-associated protein
MLLLPGSCSIRVTEIATGNFTGGPLTEVVSMRVRSLGWCLFGSNSAATDASCIQKVLNVLAVARWTHEKRGVADVGVSVIGFSSPDGSATQNLRLSALRAASVASLIRSMAVKYHVSVKILNTKGYGSYAHSQRSALILY